ncbi:glycosyltransferase [Pantoea ananatis]|uniref:glycosyltransferase n=1 Tax=Pantoea ananas TaxID=553 RepID=UPI002220C1D5|nr:glycosyltransferase [Pantoea ananatis]
MLQLAETVLKLVGGSSKIVFKPLPSDDPKQRQPDISLAKAHLDWAPKVSLASSVVVMPVFEDVEASSRLFQELANSQGPGTYVVAVDDGSVRQPVDPAAIAAAGLDGAVIRLRRNVGHQRAIAIGLSYVAEHFGDGQRVVVMDSDGEDTPHSITELVSALDSEQVDVVVATRRSRVETLRFRTFYLVYKWLFSLLSGRRISFGNFMAAKMPAVRRLAAMQELWTHVAACVLNSKLRVSTCALDRGPRYAGRSNARFPRVDGVCGGRAGTGRYRLHLDRWSIGATPGWFSLVTGILLLVFLQTGALTLIILMCRA